MRGYDLYNYNAFEEAARWYRKKGDEVVSPHEYDMDKGWVRWSCSRLGSPTGDDRPWDFTMVEPTDSFPTDTETLRQHNFDCVDKCDVICLLDGWQMSEGARAEAAYGLSKYVSFDVQTVNGYEAFSRPWVQRQLDNTQEEFETKRRSHELGDISQIVDSDIERLLAEEAELDAQHERRVVNPVTGGEKGQKVERPDLIPVGPLRAVARHYGYGATKYADRNWERGYDWNLSYAAMQRHALAFWNGEDTDAESGSHHLAAVVFHALALMEFGVTHPELDNRPSTQTRQNPTTEAAE